MKPEDNLPNSETTNQDTSSTSISDVDGSIQGSTFAGRDVATEVTIEAEKRPGCYADFRKLSFAIVVSGVLLVALVSEYVDRQADGPIKTFHPPIATIRAYIDALVATPTSVYVILVQEPITGAPIPRARVSIQVANSAGYGDITDARGIVIISLPPSLTGTNVNLKVEASGYAPWDEQIIIRNNQGPKEIQLKPITSITPTPTLPAPTPIFTVTPTVTRTSVPTSTPAPTPTLPTPTPTLATNQTATAIARLNAAVQATLDAIASPTPTATRTSVPTSTPAPTPTLPTPTNTPIPIPTSTPRFDISGSCTEIVEASKAGLAECEDINSNWLCVVQMPVEILPREFRVNSIRYRQSLKVIESINTDEQGIVVMNVQFEGETSPTRLIAYDNTVQVVGGDSLCEDLPPGMIIPTESGQSGTIEINGIVFETR